MSEQAVLQFIQHISSDVIFATKIVNSAGRDVTKIVQIAGEHGYHFTAQEFESIFGKPHRAEDSQAEVESPYAMSHA